MTNRLLVLLASAAGAVCASGAVAAADAVDGSVNPASSIHVSTAQLTFTALGKAGAKTFVVTEPWYTRTFNASSTACGTGEGAVARFTPDAWHGPVATFTVTPLRPGACVITVSDDGSGSVRVEVVVRPAPPAPSP